MAGFIKLKSNSLTDQAKTGEAIQKLAESVFKTTGDTEWEKFDADPRGWLHDKGYVYEGPGATADGRIPDNIEIVPVYDTPNRMHVKVPWAGDLTVHKFPDEDSYGLTDAVRSKVVLARYFMRKCR